MSNEDDDSMTRLIRLQLDHFGSVPTDVILSLCRVNSALTRQVDSARGFNSLLETHLRACLQDQTVTKAALGKVSAELSSKRDLLERLRKFLQAQEVKLPEDLESNYLTLMEGDPCDIKPTSSATAFNPCELHAQQTIKADAKEGQHGKGARPPRLSIISPTVVSPMPPMRLDHPHSARNNGKFTDTQVSQAATRESSDATYSLVSKEGVAGTKRKAFDRDLSSAKRLKTERDLDDLESHAPDHTVPNMEVKTEGESE
jgi:hypothetical protein